MQSCTPYRDELMAAYDLLAADWDRTHGDQSLLREAGEIFSGFVERRAKVLELGCGTGRDARLLRSLGFRYTGIDISRAMVGHARTLVPDAVFEVGDLFSPPYLADAPFHAFWANAVLLHVPKADFRRALDGIRKVMRHAPVGFLSVKVGVGERCIPDTTGQQRFFAFWERDELLWAISEANWLTLRVEERPDPLGRSATLRWLWCFIMAV